MAEGVQVLIISSASGMLLTVPGDPPEHQDKVQIQQQSSRSQNLGKGGIKTTPEQSWELIPVGQNTGIFEIVSVATGKVLDVREASTEDGAVIQQFHDHRGSNQQWRLELMDPEDPISPHFAFTIISEHSGKVLDLPLDQIEEDGANIQYISRASYSSS